MKKNKLANTNFTRFCELLKIIQTPLCQVVVWCFSLVLLEETREFYLISTCCVDF